MAHFKSHYADPEYIPRFHVPVPSAALQFGSDQKSFYARRSRGSFAVDELQIYAQLAEIFENVIDDGKRDLPIPSRNKPTSF
jgi:hypothetical protein